MLKITSTLWCITGLTVGLLSAGSCLAAEAATEEAEHSTANALLLVGYTKNGNQEGPATVSPGNASDLIAADLRQAMSNLGFEPDSPVIEQVVTALEQKQDSNTPGKATDSGEIFVSLYLACMASTSTPHSRIAFRIPKDSGAVLMEEWNSKSREAWSVVFEKASGEDATPEQWQPSYEFNASGSSEKMLGLNVREIRFGSEGVSDEVANEAGSPVATDPDPVTAKSDSSAFDSIAVRVDLKSDGSAWTAGEFEGFDIVQSFHQAYTARIPPLPRETTFWSGKLSESVGLLQHGLPLKIRKQSQSFIGETLMSTHLTESAVSSIQRVTANPGACSDSIIPDGYQVSHTLVAPGLSADSLGRTREQ